MTYYLIAPSLLLLTLIRGFANPPNLQLGIVNNQVAGIRWYVTNSPSVLIQFSEDLRQWKSAINAFSTRQNWTRGPLIEFGEARRFYRAVSPAEGVPQMLERWRAGGVRNYEFTFQRICFCADPIYYRGRVTVRDGRIVELKNTVSFRDQPIEPNPALFFTVEELFARAQGPMGNAEIIVVELDEQLHFPKKIYIDFLETGPDDQDDLRIEDFTVLP